MCVHFQKTFSRKKKKPMSCFQKKTFLKQKKIFSSAKHVAFVSKQGFYVFMLRFK